jgi:hypothetical protein
LDKNKLVNNLLFADDKILIQNKEDKLLRFSFQINQVSKSYNFTSTKDKERT